MKTRRAPYTTTELFTIINSILKEKNLLPTTLDYSLASREEGSISSYQWDPSCDLCYGGSEGIYLQVSIKGIFDGQMETLKLGTYKTLGTSREDMYTMAKLQADFIVEITDFVNERLDDFTWEGYDVDFYKGEKRVAGYTVSRKETIEGIVKRNIAHDYIIITDNRTNKKRRID